MEHFYDVTVEWTGGRKGKLSSEVLTNSIEVATPPEFPKGEAGVWSPEHFFAAAINSCLMTTFLAISENSHLEFHSFKCTAIAKLDKVHGKMLMTHVVLKPVVEIFDEEDREKALRILHKSESACLISNSVNSEITMEPMVLIHDIATESRGYNTSVKREIEHLRHQGMLTN
jgi:peroxiredoxin-like protein